MVRSSLHDEIICREIMFSDPFTETKKSTVARGKKWEEVAENLNQIARELKSKLEKEKKSKWN